MLSSSMDGVGGRVDGKYASTVAGILRFLRTHPQLTSHYIRYN